MSSATGNRGCIDVFHTIHIHTKHSGISIPKIHFKYDIPWILQIMRLSDTNVSQQKDNFRNGI